MMKDHPPPATWNLDTQPRPDPGSWVGLSRAGEEKLAWSSNLEPLLHLHNEPLARGLINMLIVENKDPSWHPMPTHTHHCKATPVRRYKCVKITSPKVIQPAYRRSGSAMRNTRHWSSADTLDGQNIVGRSTVLSN